MIVVLRIPVLGSTFGDHAQGISGKVSSECEPIHPVVRIRIMIYRIWLCGMLELILEPIVIFPTRAIGTVKYHIITRVKAAIRFSDYLNGDFLKLMTGIGGKVYCCASGAKHPDASGINFRQRESVQVRLIDAIHTRLVGFDL
ncbi:hypothetical protein DSECCO2_508550 [anaerobic digester metagenome]